MFGSHLSIAGSMLNALNEAKGLGLDTVQVFTKNQQQWKAKPLEDSLVRDWNAELKRLGWAGRTVSHASYLINLASVNDELFAKSVDLMTDEIERCEALNIAFLVHHPGSFTGWTYEQGVARIADAYRELFSRTKGFKTVSCLEGTVGSGSLLGGPFEHLAELRARIIESTSQPDRVGFCLDTCHMHSFGYDMSTREAADAHFKAFDALCGLKNLRVFHVNDSKAPAGSKRDLHQHIGEGTIGGGAEGKPSRQLKDSGFAAVVNHPAFANVPKIMETPKEDAKEAKTKTGKRFDEINLERLKKLIN